MSKDEFDILRTAFAANNGKIENGMTIFETVVTTESGYSKHVTFINNPNEKPNKRYILKVE